MVIEIALGIILAVVILALWQPILVLCLGIAGIALAIGIIALLAHFAAASPGIFLVVFCLVVAIFTIQALVKSEKNKKPKESSDRPEIT